MDDEQKRAILSQFTTEELLDAWLCRSEIETQKLLAELETTPIEILLAEIDAATR